MCRALFVAACLLASGAARAQIHGDGGAPLEYLPADHWAYEEIERLGALRVPPSPAVRSRPLARTVLADWIATIVTDSSLAFDPGVLRLRREFSRELAWAGADVPERETRPLVVVEGPGTLLRVSPVAGIDAFAATDGFSDLGRGTFAGVRGSIHVPPHFTFSEELRIRDVPGTRRVGDALVKGTDVAIDLERYSIAVRTGALEAFFGRDRFRWGPSRRGGLLLSGSAEPWTALGFAAQIGGRLRGTALHGTLNAHEGRYLAGHRLELAWGSRVVIGAAEVARYESPSPELLYVLSVVPYTVVERLVQLDTEDANERRRQRNNVLWSADAGVRWARGQSSYLEVLADDIASETSRAPDRLGLLAGHRAVFPAGARRVSAGFEAAKVWNLVYSVYYQDDCACDLSHRGEPLGFPDGPDVERIDLWADLDLSRDWRVSVEASLRRHGEGRLGDAFDPADTSAAGIDSSELSGTVETRRSAALITQWWPTDTIEARAALGLEGTTNEENDPAAPSKRRGFARLLIAARF